MKQQRETRLGVLKQTTQRLNKANITEAELDAKYLVAHVLGLNYQDIYLNPNTAVSNTCLRQIKSYTKQRVSGKPLQYILGTQAFYGLTFAVNKHVLIPRSETELLVEKVLDIAKQYVSPTVLDLCTGSGCIAIALKHHLNSASVTASDISKKALTVAKQNTKANNADVCFYHSNLFKRIVGTFDIIVSNPPYINKQDYVNLEPKVKTYEPKKALLAGKAGLDIIEQIVPAAYTKLNANGWLMMEIGYDQMRAVEALLKATNFKHIRTFADYAGFDRIVIGKKSI